MCSEGKEISSSWGMETGVPKKVIASSLEVRALSYVVSASPVLRIVPATG